MRDLKKNENLYSIEGRRKMLRNKLSFGRIERLELKGVPPNQSGVNTSL
jgi:hypothetical protein